MAADFSASIPRGLGKAVAFETAHVQDTLPSYSQTGSLCGKQVETGKTGLVNWSVGSWLRCSPVVSTSRGDFGTRTKEI